MSGHTSEKRWRRNQTPTSGKGFSEEVTELSAMLLDVLYKAENIGLDLEELKDYTGDSAQEIADQLFYEDWTARESDPLVNPGILDEQANEKEVSMVADAIQAVEAAKELFEFANKKTNNKSRISKLRRMA
jgi:hypothetical protein